MTPATEAIMGSLPKEKAGVGSAMNDVLREVGGTLGVAVLGSLLASKYADGMEDSTSSLPDPVASASLDSVDAAHVVAAQARGRRAVSLIASADQAFLAAMGIDDGRRRRRSPSRVRWSRWCSCRRGKHTATRSRSSRPRSRTVAEPVLV